MGNKLYNEHELTDDWARARDASIQYGELRNHRASTKQNDRRGSLWVACDFMDMGVMSAEAIKDTDWLELVERYRAGQTRSGRTLSESSIRKRKEALVQILKATKLSDTLHFVEMWKETKEAKEITYWNLEEMEAMNQCALILARMESDASHSLNHASCLCSRITNRGLQNKVTIRPTSSQLQMLATRERPR